MSTNSEKTDTIMVYQFKVTLIDSKPPIWRRIQVPDYFNFEALHLAIQYAMGWCNSHLHLFKMNGLVITKIFDDDARNDIDETSAFIEDYFTAPKQKAVYEYDFGDDWRHTVVLEKIEPAKKDESYPKCLAGKRACPPEDCGGVDGYEELLEILKNPSHKKYNEQKSWVNWNKSLGKDDFDSERFVQTDCFKSWDGSMFHPRPKRMLTNSEKTDIKMVYQFKVTLINSKPPIWRRIHVPDYFTFEALHLAIKYAMGWRNSRMHFFEINNRRIVQSCMDNADEGINETRAFIKDYFTAPKQKAVYTYDFFNDVWCHTVLLEKIQPAKKDESYPKCLAGKRACPPENCGGVDGYKKLLEILKNPSHNEYNKMTLWVKRNMSLGKDNFNSELFIKTDCFKSWDAAMFRPRK